MKTYEDELTFCDHTILPSSPFLRAAEPVPPPGDQLAHHRLAAATC